MSFIVYLVHGFNVKDYGERTIKTIAPYFEELGYDVRFFDYRWMGLGRVRLCNKNLAYAFAKLARPGSIAVGHSNGCAIIHHAAQFGAPFGEVVYINPALNRKAALARQIYKAHVWHSPSDVTVWTASWLPWHTWGRMGAVGYKGKDERYVNYDKENAYEISSNKHSDVFYSGKVEYFGPIIANCVGGAN